MALSLDLELFEADAARTGSRQLKRRLVKAGYDKMISYYGAAYTKGKGELIGLRFEVLSKREYNAEDIAWLNKSFLEIPLVSKYSIWTYTPEPQHLHLRGFYP